MASQNISSASRTRVSSDGFDARLRKIDMRGKRASSIIENTIACNSVHAVQ